jgi:hydroxymethylpyrimidine/phosphomethylpyrimidine kinase
VPTVLLVSGLDPSAGAGLLADARVAALLDVRAVGVVTAHTVQTTAGVSAAVPVDPALVSDELEALLGDVAVDAVKIGMLGSLAVAAAVARVLRGRGLPVVWDPILRPSRGEAVLLDADPALVLRELLGVTFLVTPNAPEAAALSGLPCEDLDGQRHAARALRDAGARAALVKGGHITAGTRAIDVLADELGVADLSSPRIAAGPVHGTGCVLATAIACALASGAELREAVDQGRGFLRERLASPLTVGKGARCLV